jgi:hypothetical protein
VERAVKPHRQKLEAEARATVCFETPPGKLMQIDFGQRLVEIGGAKLRNGKPGAGRRLVERLKVFDRRAGYRSRLSRVGSSTQAMIG